MCSSLTRKVIIKQRKQIIQKYIFTNFVRLAALYAIALFAFLNHLVQGGGKDAFGQLPVDPLPAASEGVLGQGLARQLLFCSVK